MDLLDILYIHVFKHSLPQVFVAGETMPYAKCRIATDAQVGMLGLLTHRLSNPDSYSKKSRRARCLAGNGRS
jgi:hypothetical protein